ATSSVSGELLKLASNASSSRSASMSTRTSLAAELRTMAAIQARASERAAPYGLVQGRPLGVMLECATQLRDGSNHYIVYVEPTARACFRRDLRRIGTAFGQGFESVAFVVPASDGMSAPAAMDVILVDGVVRNFVLPGVASADR